MVRCISTHRASKSPDLKYFIQRSKVLSLYRAMMKAARSLDDDTLRLDVLRQIQHDFRKNNDIVNSNSDILSSYVSTLLIQAERDLQKLRELPMKRSIQHAVIKNPFNNKNSKQSSNLECWLDIVDNEDSRGRVGTGWPWGNNGHLC